MTLKEIAALDSEYIKPCEAAPLLGCAPYSLNVMAKAGKLELPHIMIGNRLRIYKTPFLRLMGWREHDDAGMD